MQQRLQRVFRALARQGLDVRGDGRAYTVRLASAGGDVPPAEILLAEGFPLEGKALQQLAGVACLRHPDGGAVVRACATPDFHPGDAGVAIGSILHTEGMVVPAAVGTDINCGMRLHVADLPVERFLARRDEFVERMKGDYFLGTRDVVMTAASARALLRDGVPGFLLELLERPLGCLQRSDLDQLLREADRIHGGGALAGDPRWAPEGLVPAGGTLRDPGLATIGGGNHFVEVQWVETVHDRALAWAWGVREGQLAFMIHSGSRDVGKHIGSVWRQWAREAWPSGVAYPRAQLFPLSASRTPALVRDYLEAEATAANYGFANRLLLAELLRLRLRELFGELEAPLVYDLPHNLTLPDAAGGWLTRKGACPAPEGQPVILPGSMGTASYLLVGRGSERCLGSASHGAGRARSRFQMARAGASRDEAALGLAGVDCVTLRAERRIEEAPAAYKPVQPVVESQVQAGIVGLVAKLRPLLTFKA